MRLAVALLVALGLCGCATVDQDDLAVYVDQLHSSAAEGALVATQAREHKVPKVFVWLESAELLHQTEEVGEKFSGETLDPDVRHKFPEAEAIERQLKLAFENLHDRPSDDTVTGRVYTVLHRDAMASEQLENALQ